MKRIDKLSKREIDELIIDLLNAFVSCSTIEEAILFLQDLLTKNELKILSRRLRIAKLLLKGFTYEEIEKILYVSHGTVAKIAVWLSDRGEGFRTIVKKLPKTQTPSDPLKISEWENLKRRYPAYFWPELLIEEIIKGANKRQKEKLKRSLDKLDKSLEEKSDLHRQIERLLR